jgi:lysophospholipase L1-like esterase
MFSTGDGTFSSDLAAIAFALALLLAPVVLGLLIAAALRALLPSRRAQLLWTPPLVLSPVALSLVAIPHINALSFWDVLIAGLGVAAGLTLGMLQPAGGRASSGLRAGGRVLVGLLIAEVIVRVALPSAGSVPPPRSARLMVPVTNRDPPCNVMVPTEAELRERSSSGAPGRPTVLHIGDSLVAGIGVPASENFVADLNTAQPSVRHLNLGSVGAGPDVYLLALSRWARAAHPRLAVVYLFAGNDLFDLNAHYLCCPQGLLRDEGARLTPRCPTARWNIPLRAHLANSPPPFVLRALAGVSRIAGHLLTFVARVQQDVFRRGFGMVPSPNDPASQVPRWGLFERTIRAIGATAAEQHTPLLVVVLPSRTTLERTLGLPALANDYWVDRARGEAGHRRIVATAREAGLDVLDAWDFVREAMRRDGVEALFAREYPGDVHFSPLGHRRLTDWLLPALRARGVTP